MKRSFIRAVISGTFLIVLFLAVNVEAQATIRRVPTDYPTIQQAINASVNGDTVLVSPGTYIENINFHGKAIAVASEAGPDQTAIDGGGVNTVAQFNTLEEPTSILTGFTLQNGRPNDSLFGGGITIIGASPTISGNIVTKNVALRGGGILILTLSQIYPASPIIRNNRIFQNKAYFQGAGIAISATSPIVQGNVITDNGPVPNTGGVDGGGIFVGGESAQILDNIISNNTGRFGGGLELFGAGNATIRGNLIRGNSSFMGGGIDMVNFSPVEIIQNLVIENRSRASSGGISWSNPPAAIINNTIANNDGSQVSAGLSYATEFTNNIVVGATGQPTYFCQDFATLPVVFRTNNIFNPSGPAFGGICSDQTGINGNISADPLFVNPSAGDYHLRPGSPSIDSGDNTAPNLPATDLDGNPRIQDGNGDGIAVVDMGVYEALPPAPQFNICIQDDSTGSIFKFNSTTGDYQFTNCSGFTLSGIGSLIQRGSVITLQHYASDRRVLARIDTSVNKGTASIQVFSLSTTFTITDRNTTNNTCACTAH